MCVCVCVRACVCVCVCAGCRSRLAHLLLGGVNLEVEGRLLELANGNLWDEGSGKRELCVCVCV